MALAEVDESPSLGAVRLRLYETHYLIDADDDGKFRLLVDDRVPEEVRYWFLRMGLDACDPPSHVIVATAGRLVGFFRFVINNDKTELDAAGTWVSPDYRRMGLGTKMWKMALAKFPRLIMMGAVCGTREGERFLNALKKRGLPICPWPICL